MEETTEPLLALFLRANALLQRHQAYRAPGAGPFVSILRGQGRVLALLKLHPEISQKELGLLLDMKNQSLGELLAKLERSGYLTRTPSESDRRIMMVTLTAEGLAAAQRLEDRREMGGGVFDCLSPEEQSRLAVYLKRLIAALETDPLTGGPTTRPFYPGMGRSPFGPAERSPGPERGGHHREEPHFPDGWRRGGRAEDPDQLP